MFIMKQNTLEDDAMPASYAYFKTIPEAIYDKITKKMHLVIES